jgi:hypothetical protein
MSTWTPQPQGIHDISIMEMAKMIYDSTECVIINRVRLYLQLITIYDLVAYDGNQIHPELSQGKRVLSRVSTIYWVDGTSRSGSNS